MYLPSLKFLVKLHCEFDNEMKNIASIGHPTKQKAMEMAQNHCLRADGNRLFTADIIRRKDEKIVMRYWQHGKHCLGNELQWEETK